ncbi:MAG: UDP-N-acetylmuramate--L-alanine ligase [Longimicrobiaceae bacterium]
MSDLDLLGASRSGTVHFMGVGGAGMCALAQLLLRAGGSVSGCDLVPGAALRSLEQEGVRVQTGHDTSHLEGCAALVVTAAIGPNHPEIEHARELGIPVIKRSRALGAIVNRGRVVGVAGTHGKTTTTALTTSVLSAAGFDPTGLVGGRVTGWRGNLRSGKSDLFVVEADEYDRSFHQLSPSAAVITSLEADHLDVYGDLASVESAFLDFTESVPADGLVAGCGDDPGVGRLMARLGPGRNRLTYGLNAGSMVRAEEISTSEGETRFSVREDGRKLGRALLTLPGFHNVRNALAAVAVARWLGAAWEPLAEGLASFQGVERRFERVGEAGGVVVIDDYAHHPTEILATLRAGRAAFPGRRVVAVFQPHLYTRTRDFSAEFGRALALADLVMVTDVYPARESPLPGVTGELVAGAVRSRGAETVYLAGRELVAGEVAGRLKPGDLCLTLGAGDLNLAAREILGLLGRTP